MSDADTLRNFGSVYPTPLVADAVCGLDGILQPRSLYAILADGARTEILLAKFLELWALRTAVDKKVLLLEGSVRIFTLEDNSCYRRGHKWPVKV